ncbi:MAG: rhodanese-like domain-containing protein [Rudaea sp.]|uniref:rhodanese-like domain-containing protein n=1 Tax=Rudaea sp. TaxID=2136325 RepID=UPI0039E6D4A0
MRHVLAAIAAAAISLTATAQDNFDQNGRMPSTTGTQSTYPPPSGTMNGPSANMPGQNGMPANTGQYPNGGGASQDAMTQAELQDFGVAPTRELHPEPMHAPTPNSIPGGQVITTPGLLALMQVRQVHALIFDVLGGQETLPGAIYAAPASQAGNFQDQTQQQFGQFLQQQTQGHRDVPLVFYCLSSHCWMSYNASLRAINLGYTNVFWYRGGIEAWQHAGQSTQRSQAAFNGPPMPQTQTGNGYPPSGGPQQNTNGYQQTGTNYPASGGGYPQPSNGYYRQ